MQGFRDPIFLLTALLSLQLAGSLGSDTIDQRSHHAAESTGWTTVTGFGSTTVQYREVSTGICELQSNVTSYSGYVNIAEDVHMFFWFFGARNVDPEDAPLTAWISGGPGASSMSELFTEHGPCRVQPDGETIVFNPFSWNNYSNVVYIDQPVQVGFSYTDLVPAYVNDDDGKVIKLKPGKNCPQSAAICGNFSVPDPSKTANSTIAAAPNFWTTLQSFMTAFPQYTRNGVNLASESYGGHYIPIFTKYILDQNDRDIPGAITMNITSILIGNGWFSPSMQTEAYYTFGFDPGNTYGIPSPPKKVRKRVHEALYGKHKGLDGLRKCNAGGSDAECRKIDHYCSDHVQAPWLAITGRDDNDIREIADSPFPNGFYSDYLQLAHVRAAIGARQTYIEDSPTVGLAFDSTGDDARELDIVPILQNIVKRGILVTLYAGDADYECNWFGIEAVCNNIGDAVPGFTDRAGYTNLLTSDNIVHGQVKQAGGFAFVRVYQAGHAVGAFQPLALFEIFDRTMRGLDIASGIVDVRDGELNGMQSYTSMGTKNSTYREGNATVLYQVWPENSMYDYITNLPTLEDFQPSWNDTE